MKIVERQNFAELQVEFAQKELVTLNLKDQDYFVARKYAPVFKSTIEFPYHEGEEVVFDNTPVKIKGFKEEANSLFVCLLQRDGYEKFVRLDLAVLHLAEEMPRKDVRIVDLITRRQVSIEQMSVGQIIEYTNCASRDKRKRMTGRVVEVTQDDRNVKTIQIDFGVDGMISFVGNRFSFN